jgi:hypothetical protein
MMSFVKKRMKTKRKRKKKKTDHIAKVVELVFMYVSSINVYDT